VSASIGWAFGRVVHEGRVGEAGELAVTGGGVEGRDDVRGEQGRGRCRRRGGCGLVMAQLAEVFDAREVNEGLDG
jgi:hypothetical protein